MAFQEEHQHRSRAILFVAHAILLWSISALFLSCSGPGTASKPGPLPKSKATIVRQGDTVMITGTKPLGWGMSGNNTFMAALSAIMDVVGDSASYEYLMGVSGAAFRLQLFGPDGEM